MTLTQDKLSKIWEVATSVGQVEGWTTHIHEDVHVLAEIDREKHGHYERKAPDGEWKMVPGMWSR